MALPSAVGALHHGALRAVHQRRHDCVLPLRRARRLLLGYTPCRQRELAGTTLVSTFSTQNVTSAFGALTCPEDAPWANCLDMPCELDSLNPALATCQCQMVETGPSFTFGGGCDTNTCSAVIWSAASPPGVTQYVAAMGCVNQLVTFPATCPGATPVASPSGTPEG